MRNQILSFGLLGDKRKKAERTDTSKNMWNKPVTYPFRGKQNELRFTWVLLNLNEFTMTLLSITAIHAAEMLSTLCSLHDELIELNVTLLNTPSKTIKASSANSANCQAFSIFHIKACSASSADFPVILELIAVEGPKSKTVLCQTQYGLSQNQEAPLPPSRHGLYYVPSIDLVCVVLHQFTKPLHDYT